MWTIRAISFSFAVRRIRSRHEHAAVDVNGLTGDVGRGGLAQHPDDLRDVLRNPFAADRRLTARDAFAGGGGAWPPDPPGHHAIHGDADSRELSRERAI